MMKKINTAPGNNDRMTGACRFIYILLLPGLFCVTFSHNNTAVFWGPLVGAVLLLSMDHFHFRRLIARSDWIVTCAMVSMVLICAASKILQMRGGVFYFIDTNIQIGSVLVFLIALYLFRYHNDECRLSLRILSVIIWITAVAGLIYFFATGSFPARRLTWPYENPLPAGTCMLIGFWLPMTDSRKKDFLLNLVYLPAIFLSQCRSVWLGLLVSWVLYLIHVRREVAEHVHALSRWKTLWIFCIAAALIMGVLMLPPVRAIVVSRLTRNEVSVIGPSIRMDNARFLIEEYVHSNPFFILFGHGPGSMGRAFQYSGQGAKTGYDVVDNSFLSLTFEYGLIMLAALLYVVYKNLRAVFRMSEGNRSLNQRQSTCFPVAVTGSMIVAFFYDVQLLPTPMVVIVVCVGAALVDMEKSRAAKADR